jgi:hypothetical protein
VWLTESDGGFVKDSRGQFRGTEFAGTMCRDGCYIRLLGVGVNAFAFKGLPVVAS